MPQYQQLCIDGNGDYVEKKLKEAQCIANKRFFLRKKKIWRPYFTGKFAQRSFLLYNQVLCWPYRRLNK